MFSVIIPVHNSEKTLRRCLDSVIGQTYDDLEALLIENGSSDNSLNICLEYEKKDCRFKTFDIGKCNGPSKARNYGLDNAKGDYIAFVDSDDWIEPEHLKLFSNALTNSDIAFCGYSFDDENGKNIKHIIPDINANKKNDKCYELIKSDCFGYSCCVAFARNKHKDIRFDETINLFEDLDFTSKLLEGDEDLDIIPTATYHYVQSNASAITHSVHMDMIQKKDKQFKAQHRLLKGKYDDYLIEFANDCVSFCVNYAFENGFNILDSFKRIKDTFYYHFAKEKPNKWTSTISKGYICFLLKYAKYRLKRKLYDIFYKN